MSDSDNTYLDYSGKELTELPSKEPGWNSGHILILSQNNIHDLDASMLPRSLTYLDLSDNRKLTHITGEFPPGLKSLIISDTMIGKLPKLPPVLEDIDISRTPIGDKYGIEKGSVDDIKRLTDWSVDTYDLVMYHSDLGKDRPELLMILRREETNTDIVYTAQTLEGEEVIIPKQDLVVYEPAFSEEFVTRRVPGVYVSQSHGEDILFEKPVPPGCVYVTIEECGRRSMNWAKLLFAFEDYPAGIREKLRDPVTHRLYLMSHFGNSFHVHYSESTEPGDRTYIENIQFPVLGFSAHGCRIGKSGLFSLDDNVKFVDKSVDGSEYDQKKVVRDINCMRLTDADLHEMFDDSVYPTYDMVSKLVYMEGDNLKYSDLVKALQPFTFSQSWAFKKFPGIHYNFACRVIPRHYPNNERLTMRRRVSIRGPLLTLDTASDANIHGVIGRGLLIQAVKAGKAELISKLVERGIDVNIKNEENETLLQEAAYGIKLDSVKELLKAKNIDITGALKSTRAGISMAETKDLPKETLAILKDSANEIIRLLESHKAITGGNKTRRKYRAKRSINYK
jgi:hypothetical protein